MEVELKFDNQLELPNIEMFEQNVGLGDSEKDGADTDMVQTKVYGVTTPLIKVNNMVIPFNSIVSFVMKNEQVPTVEMAINDRMDIMETFDKPKSDNMIQVQILPPFDNAYKKINLTFFITSYRTHNRIIYIDATYIVPTLYDCVLKAYGKTTTYKLFESVAKQLKLGFCSNLENTDDERYIYIPNKQYIDSLNKEITYGGTERQDLEWWIDYWNNINLVDVAERMNTIDKDLTIWVYPHRYFETDDVNSSEPILLPRTISNSIALRDIQTYVSDYKEEFDPGINMNGTDMIISSYTMKTCEENTMFLQDGDVKNDIYVKYEYLGENFGDYDYLTKSECRNMIMRKNSNNIISVKMFTPHLGLMKGHKVNFMWYKTGDIVQGISDSGIETNMPAENTDQSSEQAENFLLDKQISGQYYIKEVNLYYKYNSGAYNWVQELILARPSDQIEYYDFDDMANEKQ
jgi:hypothetical protein